MATIGGTELSVTYSLMIPGHVRDAGVGNAIHLVVARSDGTLLVDEEGVPEVTRDRGCGDCWDRHIRF